MKRVAAAVGVFVIVLLDACAAWSSGNAGQREYDADCASCHGAGGKGNGPEAASLVVKPADLTVLAKKNGGQFPTAYVRQVIDGRAHVAAHGSREMPVWGIQFQVVPRDQPQAPSEEPFGYREDQVQARIGALIAYLAHLQKQ